MAETNTNSEQTVLTSFSFGRETLIEKPSVLDSDEEVFAICVDTDDENLLKLTKVYKVRLRGDLVRVIDEEGEAAIYPLDNFLVLSLSPTAKNKLAEVVG